MEELPHAMFPVFGTGAVVATVDPEGLDPAVATVRRVCEEFDAACSGFRTDSDVEKVNRCAGTWVAAGSLFLSALSEALRVAAATDGDVDPTVGSAVHRLGYDRDFAAVPADGPAVIGIEPVPGYARVRIDRQRRRARIPAGVRLDLGATAKALAADRAAAAAASAAGCGALVSLGGDVAVEGPPPAGGWEVGLADWHGDSAPGRSVRIRSGGLATSSTTVRSWRRGGDRVHHIVDPRTGRSALEVWRTVSVAAATCVDANAASTAAVIRGERAPAWLEELELPAMLVRTDGSIVRTAGWPAEVAA